MKEHKHIHIHTSVVVLFGIATIIFVLIACKTFPFVHPGAFITTLEGILLCLIGLINITICLVDYGHRIFQKFVLQFIIAITAIQILCVVDAVYYAFQEGFTVETLRTFGILGICILGVYMSWLSLAKDD